MWYDLSIQKRPEGDSLSADVHVPGNSAWFDGHFPGAPVLPGIAQLAMVFDLLRQTFQDPVRVKEVSRVRFKQMIMPEDHLVVVAEPRPGRVGAYAFRITKNEELVCSGTMTVVPINSVEK
jgi:3-hydroxymyristoyl/3-hydroxydecanoyl-(acyl carrier protein) dehydratase